MHPLRRWSVRLSLSIVAAIAPVLSIALDITTEHNPPFNYQNGQHVSGISTEILLEMGRRAGVPLHVQMLPWARAYQSALSLPGTCVYSTVRLPEREDLFKWVGPLSTNKWALFAKSDFDKRIRSIEEAKNYRIGGVTMDAKAAYLKSLGFKRIDLVGDDSLNRAKLLAGRIDLWIAGLYRTTTAENRGQIKPVFIVREVEYYLACHPETPEKTIAALQQALATLQKEGFVKAVTDRYANRLH
ncbi:MAG TPA: transporter substrate-binding domain-containing protein [Noviherbaspirillum sp.]